MAVKQGWKVTYKTREGLFPPMVANEGGKPTPLHQRVMAQEPEIVGYTKKGAPHVQCGGKGTHTSKGELTYAPGWHISELPNAPQFLHKDGTWPKELVFVRVMFNANNDYTEEAKANGGILRRIPANGFYRRQTNTIVQGAPYYYISSDMEIMGEVSMDEVNKIREANGLPRLEVR